MRPISKYYVSACKCKYECKGFTKSKLTFARMSGDIIQAFTLTHSERAPICSVNFGVFPLCMPTPVFLDAGRYELDMFAIDHHLMGTGWLYDVASSASIQNCVEGITQTIDQHLLPFFDACYDCRSALLESIKLEDLFERNRKIMLHQIHETDCALPWSEREFHDSRKYYMALKAKDLSYAINYLNYQIDFCKRKLKFFNGKGAPKQPDIVVKRFEEKLALYTEQLEKVELSDSDYIHTLLHRNEQQMLEYIASKYPKIIKM